MTDAEEKFLKERFAAWEKWANSPHMIQAGAGSATLFDAFSAGAVVGAEWADSRRTEQSKNVGEV